MTKRRLDQIITNSALNIAVERKNEETKPSELLTATYTPGLFERLSGRLSDMFLSSKPAHNFSQNSRFHRRILEWADRQSYLALVDITVYAPVGLKVSYMEYLEALESVLPHMLDVEDQILIPVSQVVGTYLNDPSTLSSRSTITTRSKLLDRDIDKLVQPVTKCFDMSRREDTITYKQAFRRNGELEQASTRLLQLQDNVTRIDNDKLLKRIKAIFKQAESLAEQIRLANTTGEPAAFANVSNATSKEISTLLFKTARWVEMVSLFQYQIKVLSTAINDTEKKLLKLAK